MHIDGFYLEDAIKAQELFKAGWTYDGLRFYPPKIFIESLVSNKDTEKLVPSLAAVGVGVLPAHQDHLLPTATEVADTQAADVDPVEEGTNVKQIPDSCQHITLNDEEIETEYGSIIGIKPLQIYSRYPKTYQVRCPNTKPFPTHASITRLTAWRARAQNFISISELPAPSPSSNSSGASR